MPFIRRHIAILTLCLYSAFLALWWLHPYVLHRHHEHPHTCSTHESETHLHADGFTPDECLWCLLHDANPSLLLAHELPTFTLLVAPSVTFGWQQSAIFVTPTPTDARGPPTARCA